jgi:hypothetical protein
MANAVVVGAQWGDEGKGSIRGVESKMASSDRDRAYLMAQGAWRRFRHTSEPEERFASRIADIGAAQGLQAAAEAIAQNCREYGLEMSAQRVLKSLASDLSRAGQPGPQRISDGLTGIIESGRTGQSGDPGCAIFLLVVVVLALIAWFWLF